MMKTSFLILSILVGFTQFVNGQKDSEAQQILKAAAEKALAHSSIYTKFEFVVENAQNEKEDTYEGELWLKNTKFKMMVDNTITFCDGKSRWVYLPEAAEVNVSKLEIDDSLDPEERFLVEPKSLFTLYERGFKYTISGTQQINGKNYNVIDLSPEDINKPYFKIKIWISESHDYFAVKYFQKDGTRIALELNKFEVDTKLKDAFFVFDVKEHPDVEVIDLRE